MRALVTEGQMGLTRGTSTMAAPRKYSLELRERAVRMYRTTDPKRQIKKLAVDLGKTAALCQPPCRAGRRVRCGNKTIPSPEIALA